MGDGAQDSRAARPRPPAGARLQGRPQRLHLARWGGEWRLGRQPCRACLRAPTPTAGLSLQPNGAAQRELPGTRRPAPRAWFRVGPKFRPPTTAAPTRWKMSSPPAAITGGGATAPHRARRGWTCVRPRNTRGRLRPPPAFHLAPQHPPILRLAQGLKELDREGAGDIEAASLPGQGR